jgi:hypothetical protein
MKMESMHGFILSGAIAFVMSIKFKISQLVLIGLFLISGISKTTAQPGDYSFNVVPVDEFGFVGCSSDNYKLYACKVDYPDRSPNSDSLELRWSPILKTLRILDTLRCLPNQSYDAEIPYESCFRAKSCLNTNILAIIRNDKDTMLINSGGSDPYSWRLDPTGVDAGLPFLFTFQKGLFHLNKLYADKGRVILHNATFHTWILNHNRNSILIPNQRRITFIALNDENYGDNDIIKITLTGTLLTDGGCNSGNLLWTLQKSENDKWITVKDFCCDQMDCGKPSVIANNRTFILFIQKNQLGPEQSGYPRQLANPKGKYKIIIYDDFFQPYRTEEFTIN